MNTHTMVSDLHRNALMNREGAGSKRNSVSANFPPTKNGTLTTPRLYQGQLSQVDTMGSTVLLSRRFPPRDSLYPSPNQTLHLQPPPHYALERIAPSSPAFPPRDSPYPTLKQTLHLQPPPHYGLERIAPSNLAPPPHWRQDSSPGTERFSSRERLTDARPIMSRRDHTTTVKSWSFGEISVQTTNRTSRPSNEHVAPPPTRIATPGQRDPHRRSLKEPARSNPPASGRVAEPPAQIKKPGLNDPLRRPSSEIPRQKPSISEQMAESLARINKLWDPLSQPSSEIPRQSPGTGKWLAEYMALTRKPSPYDLLQRPSSEILQESPPASKRLAEQLTQITKPGLDDPLPRPPSEILRPNPLASELLAAWITKHDLFKRPFEEIIRPNPPASERISEPLTRIPTPVQQNPPQQSPRELLRAITPVSKSVVKFSVRIVFKVGLSSLGAIICLVLAYLALGPLYV